MNRSFGAWGAADAMLSPLALDPVLMQMRMVDPYTPGAVLEERRRAQIAAAQAAAEAARSDRRVERRDNRMFVMLGVAAVVVGLWTGSR